MTLPSVGEAFTERSGVNYVATVVNNARCLWRETLMHDVGIDGQIEYVNSNNEATGRIVLVQVKSGASYFKSETATSIPYYPAAKHRTYWEKSPLPVILVLHNPDTRETYWTDARSVLRERRGNVISAIEVPKTQSFDISGVVSALAQLGPLPSNPGLPSDLARLLMDQRNANLKLDFFDLFVHGLVQLAESLYFGMDLVTDLSEIKAAESEFGVSLGSTDYEFILEYVRFLVEQDLVRVDFDAFMRYWDNDQYVQTFMSPLTARGRLLKDYISKEDNSEGIRVIQDKAFQGIYSFEHHRRVYVVENFKRQFLNAKLKTSPDIDLSVES